MNFSKKKIFHNLNFVLVSILPLAFVVGPLIVEIIAIILIVNFLISSVNNKNYFILENKIFIYFFAFYFFLILCLLFSKYFDETSLNVLLYLRFILFAFAISLYLKKNQENLKKIFIIFSIIFFIIIFDGYFQFFNGENLLGFKQHRLDRISGFFKEDLILGSFLSRMLPLFIGLTFYFQNNKKLTVINSAVILLSIFLIFLTGERSAFFKTIILLIIIFLTTNINLKFKLFSFLSIVIALTFLITLNPIIKDRYYNQTKTQILGLGSKTILPYYYPMFQTSFKMFNESKFFGHGPKTYRYLCDDKKFVSYYPNKLMIDNTVIKLSTSWKELRNFLILEFYIKENDIIKKGDKLFKYKHVGDEDHKIFFSTKEGKVKDIRIEEKYVNNTAIIKIAPQNSPEKEYVYKNACNTHPHNFYIQLLAETGILGFVYILLLFLFLGFLLLKNFLYNFVNNKKKLTDLEICIIAGFFVTLFPISTNGNFFNNWINLISFYPLGFLLHAQYLKKIKNV